MKIEIRNQKDFYAGLVFLLFGGLAVAIARHYPIGTAARMGPGYFPMVLGGILGLLGIGISARSLLGTKGDSVTGWALKPLLFILGGVLAFAFLVDRLGLVLAILVLILLSCLGGEEFRLREVALLLLVLVGLAVGIFFYGLQMPFKVWPL